MAPVTGAHIYRNAIVTIDDVEYANQLDKARLVPDQPVQVKRTLVPDGAVVDVDSATWVFEIAGLQVNKPNGLAAALRAASGEQVTVTLQPRVGAAEATATFDVIALMPEFGGEQGNWLSQELSLPVVGQPVFGVSA